MWFSAKILRHLLAPLILFLLAALIIARSSRAGADEGSRLLALIDRGSGSKVRFSVLVPGPTRVEREPDEVLPPGALTQLFTVAAALERLGPNYSFETRIEWRTPFAGQPEKISGLTLLGAGDPSWGMTEWNETELARLDQVAQLLKDQGVTEIHGPIRLVAEDPRWDQVGPGVGWLESDLLTCEGAIPQAFNVHLNCATLVIESPTQAHWKEDGVPLQIRLELETGHRTVLKPEREKDGYLIRGSWAERATLDTIRLPVPNPRAWVERLLEAALESKGIRHQVRSPDAESAAGRFVLASHSASIHSPPLKELIKPVLQNGVGLVAESLFVALGGQSGLRTYLDIHLPDERLVSLWDGSGLSRANRVTARSILSLLSVLGEANDFNLIWDSLAVAGVRGNLESRMRRTPAEGILRAKAGSIPGYSQIAGYVPRYDGAGQVVELMPFALLSRAKPRRLRAAQAAEDRAGAELSRAVNH